MHFLLQKKFSHTNFANKFAYIAKKQYFCSGFDFSDRQNAIYFDFLKRQNIT